MYELFILNCNSAFADIMFNESNISTILKVQFLTRFIFSYKCYISTTHHPLDIRNIEGCLFKKLGTFLLMDSIQ